jgi:hypothetical protein
MLIKVKKYPKTDFVLCSVLSVINCQPINFPPWPYPKWVLAGVFNFPSQRTKKEQFVRPVVDFYYLIRVYHNIENLSTPHLICKYFFSGTRADSPALFGHSAARN